MPTPRLRAINWFLVGLLLVVSGRSLHTQSLLKKADIESKRDRDRLRDQLAEQEMRRERIDEQLERMDEEIRSLKAKLEAKGH